MDDLTRLTREVHRLEEHLKRDLRLRKEDLVKAREAGVTWLHVRRVQRNLNRVKGQRDRLVAARRKLIFRRWMLNGHPGNVTRAVKRTIVRGVSAGLVVTSTTDGGHAQHSWHYVIAGRNALGHAVDLASGSTVMMREFQHREFDRGRRKGYSELFGPSNELNLKEGHPLDLMEGSDLEDLHDNHVHVAP